MPIYEYQCKTCGHQLESFQSFSDAPLTDCPECHKPTLAKLVSATSFQLKGTGWYATDIRDKGKPKPTDTGVDSASTSEAPSAATDTNTKPSDNSNNDKAD